MKESNGKAFEPKKRHQIAMGCMSLPANDADFTYKIHQAIAGGITSFDTADLYEKGQNEQALGRALHTKRTEVQLYSKVGNRWRADGSGWDWCANPVYIRQQIDQTLHHLQTDYLDLYFLHGGTLEDPAEEVIACFEELKKQGKILAYGLSSIRPQVIEKYTRLGDFDAVMTQFSVLDSRPLEQIIPLLTERSIPILARGVLAQGALVNRKAASYLSHQPNQLATFLSEWQRNNPTAQTRFNAALDWIFQHPIVEQAVVGIRTEAQLEMALAYKNQPVDFIEKFTHWSPIHYTEHRIEAGESGILE